MFERISNIESADLFTVLKFQELIPAVARHVDEYIRAVVREQAFRPWNGRLHATYSRINVLSGLEEKTQKAEAERTSQQTQEILHCDFVPAIVNFDVLAIEVECVAAVCEHAAREMVARIASRIVGEHKDDV